MTNLFNKSQKIGRNELCPCGSGKKYKRCCLEEDEKNERKNVKDEYFQRIKEEDNLSDNQVATIKAIDYILEKYGDAVNNAIQHFVAVLLLMRLKKRLKGKVKKKNQSFFSYLTNMLLLITKTKILIPLS